MKKLLTISLITLVCACNNSKKEKQVTNSDTTTTNPASSDNSSNSSTTTMPAAGSATVRFSVNDTAYTLEAHAFVQKDKSNLSPGNNNLAIVTGSNNSGETITVNFLFDTKPGTYPVVGLGLTKNSEVYGGILGGDPKLTKYKINLTECTDLGDNGIGGHKWKLAGSVDEEMLIDAMSIMKLNPAHPDNVKVNKYQFSNLNFDDNMEKLMEEGMKKLKNQ